MSSSYRNRLARTRPPSAEEPPDPRENFKLYTEVDPNGRLTVLPHTITVAAMDRDEHVVVYDDKGVDHFAAAWEHKLKTSCDHTPGKTLAYATAFPWSVSQTVANAATWSGTNANAISLQWYDDATAIRLYLRDWNTGSIQNHSYGNAAAIFTAYPIVQRLTETHVQCRIYSDAARLNLVDTLNITITSGRRYRYVFAMNSFDSGPAGRPFYGEVNDLYL